MVLQKIFSALFRVQLSKSMQVVNHDWMKLCKDRKLPEWLTKLLERSDGAETVAAED